MFTVAELLAWTEGKMLGPSVPSQIVNVRIDSRLCEPGSCFIALPGTKAHGGEFMDDAYARGASSAVVGGDWINGLTGREGLEKKKTLARRSDVVVVSDAKRALWQMAENYRKKFSVRTVAITGSFGKTSTKEILSQILAVQFKVHSSPASFNNDLGVPLTILGLEKGHEFYVQELGASEQGSIRRLAELAQPEIGILTSVGMAHLEGFKSLDGVFKAKLELADFLTGRGGTLIFDGDNGELADRLKKYSVRKISFGKNPSCSFNLTDVQHDPEGYRFTIKNWGEFFIPTPARFQVKNALAALAACKCLDLAPEICREALKSIKWPKGRFTVLRLPEDITVIDDTYNANPQAFIESLEAFITLPGKRRLIVCGDMLELGDQSFHLHEELGQKIARLNSIYGVIGVGSETRSLVSALNKSNERIQTWHFNATQEVRDFLKSFLKSGDLVLFKGSRGMQLERIIEDLRTCFTPSLKP